MLVRLTHCVPISTNQRRSSATQTQSSRNEFDGRSWALAMLNLALRRQIRYSATVFRPCLASILVFCLSAGCGQTVGPDGSVDAGPDAVPAMDAPLDTVLVSDVPVDTAIVSDVPVDAQQACNSTRPCGPSQVCVHIESERSAPDGICMGLPASCGSTPSCTCTELPGCHGPDTSCATCSVTGRDVYCGCPCC